MGSEVARRATRGHTMGSIVARQRARTPQTCRTSMIALHAAQMKANAKMNLPGGGKARKERLAGEQERSATAAERGGRSVAGGDLAWLYHSCRDAGDADEAGPDSRGERDHRRLAVEGLVLERNGGQFRCCERFRWRNDRQRHIRRWGGGDDRHVRPGAGATRAACQGCSTEEQRQSKSGEGWSARGRLPQRGSVANVHDVEQVSRRSAGRSALHVSYIGDCKRRARDKPAPRNRCSRSPSATYAFSIRPP